MSDNGIRPGRLHVKRKSPPARSQAKDAYSLPPDLQQDEEELLHDAASTTQYCEAGEEAGVPIPRRWLEAAEQGRGRRHKLAGGMHEMDEEEYAEFVRAGHHARTRAGQAETQKFAAEEEARRKGERETKEVEQRRQKKKRKRREEKKEREKEELSRARQAYDAPWTMQLLTSIRDVPWPVYPAATATLDRGNIEHFLFADTSATAGARRLRASLRRFHPDRFGQAHAFPLDDQDKTKSEILQRAKTVAQILADIVVDRRSGDHGSRGNH